MFRFIFLTIVAYFIFKGLDGIFGKRKPSRNDQSRASKSQKSSVNKNVGEYVDYEEVKDEEQ
jgi:hypothetical protein